MPVVERCRTCDLPLATDADLEGCIDGCQCERCVSLRWMRYGGKCTGRPVDWRARALKAEQDRDTARAGIARVFGAIESGMLDLVHGEMAQEYGGGPPYFVEGPCPDDDTCACPIRRIMLEVQFAGGDENAARLLDELP